ncbi:MAG: hypothetical protein JO025_03140 [Verrucomicrobia bacterium]|nr:hypothetical protein [Verrucomicrobiota bacterium]
MAQPILLELRSRDPREELYDRLKNAPHEHAEALLNVFAILEGLQDRGILEMAKGGLGSSEKVLKILVDFANKPEIIRGIRNLMILARIADSFEPKLLEDLEQGVQEGLAQAQKLKPIGLLQLLKKVLSQESRRVLILTTTILRAFGNSLGKHGA